MKTFTTVFFTVLISSLIFLGFRNNDPETKNTPKSSPEHTIKFYEDLHRPYGAILPQNIQDMILLAVSKVPDESLSDPKAVNNWI
jgi:hypothetical protein